MLLIGAMLGLCMGSALHWAADYLPRLVASRPATVKAHPRWRLASWQWLRAITRKTFSREAWSGVAVEWFTALLCAYLWQRFALSWSLLLATAISAFFILIALIDWRYRLILNVLIFPAALITLLVHGLARDVSMAAVFGGGAFGLTVFWLAARARPGQLGSGDIKLATFIGLLFGFPHALWALIIGVLAGGLTAIALLLMRFCGDTQNERWNAHSQIPYAPFLCLGALMVWLM